jgi:putative endonuclease
VSIWTLYIIQSTVHGKLYTGISVDPDRWLAQHNAGKGAKFTKVGGPWKTVYREVLGPGQGNALKRELAVKRLSRSQKLRLTSVR